jgi:hypothetical protein
MPFQLATPAHVGDLNSGITVGNLEIAAISLNLQRAHVSKGRAILSIVLEDPTSGWTTTVTYQDETALAFWAQLGAPVSGALIDAIWAKLQADGKLPVGTADPQIPQLAAAQTAAAAIAAKVAAPASPISTPSTTP